MRLHKVGNCTDQSTIMCNGGHVNCTDKTARFGTPQPTSCRSWKLRANSCLCYSTYYVLKLWAEAFSNYNVTIYSIFVISTTTTTMFICQNCRKPERATAYQSWLLILNIILLAFRFCFINVSLFIALATSRVNNDDVYSQSNADICSKKQNTILLNDRQRNRHASKQDKWRRLGLYANEESRQRELHVQANNRV